MGLLEQYYAKIMLEVENDNERAARSGIEGLKKIIHTNWDHTENLLVELLKKEAYGLAKQLVDLQLGWDEMTFFEKPVGFLLTKLLELDQDQSPLGISKRNEVSDYMVWLLTSEVVLDSEDYSPLLKMEHDMRVLKKALEDVDISVDQKVLFYAIQEGSEEAVELTITEVKWKNEDLITGCIQAIEAGRIPILMLILKETPSIFEDLPKEKERFTKAVLDAILEEVEYRDHSKVLELLIFMQMKGFLDFKNPRLPSVVLLLGGVDGQAKFLKLCCENGMVIDENIEKLDQVVLRNDESVIQCMVEKVDDSNIVKKVRGFFYSIEWVLMVLQYEGWCNIVCYTRKANAHFSERLDFFLDQMANTSKDLLCHWMEKDHLDQLYIRETEISMTKSDAMNATVEMRGVTIAFNERGDFFETEEKIDSTHGIG